MNKVIQDSIAFVDYKVKLHIDFVGIKGSKDFFITLNFPTGQYYKIVAQMAELQNVDADNVFFIREKLAEITSDILSTCNDEISPEWVIKNVDIQTQNDIISMVLNKISEILQKDCFQIPNIEINKETISNGDSDSEKKRKYMRKQIDRLNNRLSGKVINLMDDIAILTTKTNNSYQDIMDMPLFAFKDLVRTVVLNELRTDENYNLAYLEYMVRKYELSGKAENEKPTQNKGVDLDALDAMIATFKEK